MPIHAIVDGRAPAGNQTPALRSTMVKRVTTGTNLRRGAAFKPDTTNARDVITGALALLDGLSQRGEY